MTTLAVRGAQARQLLVSNAGVLQIFAATIFLSAFLLFSVQPVFAKMVLPKLGGSPSVWAVSMCFFQAVLLAGYCYAHALNRYAPGRTGAAIHLTLMALAVLALPFGLPANATPPAGDAYLWLIGTLAALHGSSNLAMHLLTSGSDLSCPACGEYIEFGERD